MSAMIVPPYDVLAKTKKRTKLFNDIKKDFKKNLGPEKDWDGWNFGYDCIPTTTIIQNIYG